MNLSFAFLADYAQVQDGKVHVIGGGVTVLWRPDFPAPLGVSIVASFAYNNAEAGSQRTLRLLLNDADGSEVMPPLELGFIPPPRAEAVPTRVPLEAAFAITLPNSVPVIPAAGDYVVELFLDKNHVRSLPFAAVSFSEMPEPPELPASD